eukprot:138279_1
MIIELMLNGHSGINSYQYFTAPKGYGIHQNPFHIIIIIIWHAICYMYQFFADHDNEAINSSLHSKGTTRIELVNKLSTTIKQLKQLIYEQLSDKPLITTQQLTANGKSNDIPFENNVTSSSLNIKHVILKLFHQMTQISIINYNKRK